MAKVLDLDAMSDDEIWGLYKAVYDDDCGLLDVDEGTTERKARRATAIGGLRCAPDLSKPVTVMGGEPIGPFAKDFPEEHKSFAEGKPEGGDETGDE